MFSPLYLKNICTSLRASITKVPKGLGPCEEAKIHRNFSTTYLNDGRILDVQVALRLMHTHFANNVAVTATLFAPKIVEFVHMHASGRTFSLAAVDKRLESTAASHSSFNSMGNRNSAG